jgi:deferrochelatase/peroxidase EfeB
VWPGDRRRHAAKTPANPASDLVPFWGEHQGGIATPQQRCTYIDAFDLRAKQRAHVEQLLRDWTAAADVPIATAFGTNTLTGFKAFTDGSLSYAS